MKTRNLSDIIRLTQKLRETNKKNGKLSKKSIKDLNEVIELLDDIMEREGELIVRDPLVSLETVRIFIEELSVYFATKLLNGGLGQNNKDSS